MIVTTVFALKVTLLGSYFNYLAVCTLVFLFYKILEWQYNSWIVSNLGIIEETGIFTRVTMECLLDKINNVSYSQNIWGRLFGFGNVIIQTAAQHGATIYSNVERPQTSSFGSSFMSEVKSEGILSRVSSITSCDLLFVKAS